MKFGLYGACLGAMASADAYRIARLAEDLGYESLWTGEHVSLPDPQAPPAHRDPTHPFFDPIVAMSFLAARTTTIKLGLGVLILPQRHPVQLAKELATLDILSAGRLVVGVGVGYLEPEYRSVGVDFHTRGVRADEYLATLRTMWNDPIPAFKGRFVNVGGINAYPRPVTPGGPPILVGGNSPTALQRCLAFGSGWIGGPGRTPSESAATVAKLRLAAESAGRDPATLEITQITKLPPDPDTIAQYAAGGVDRLVITAEGDTLDDVEAIVRKYQPEG